ncbi:MAG: enoyl-CoA hydratase/isomerase family protein [Pseudomonadota bacterium]
MSFEHLAFDNHSVPHVIRITLHRPQVRNAFNSELIAELDNAFEAIAADPQVRAVVLAAEGKTFCAGADLNWMQAMAGYTWFENLADAQALAQMLHRLYTCPVPVVARIQGDCYGGGVGLAAVCDVLVVAEGVQFCLSEAKLGLVPATISPYVVRALGAQAARRYFVTAERFSAQRAQALGWVHEVCAAELLDTTVDAIVASIAANGPLATRACKALVQDVVGRPLTDALQADTARLIADIRSSPEGQEGIRSFLDKRPPAWR